MKKTVIKTTEQVDSKTGELLDKKFEKVSYEKNVNFVKLYITDITRLYALTGAQNSVLWAMIGRMNYLGEVVFTGLIRKEIQKAIRISESTFKNTLNALQDIGITYKIENNRYLLNPHIFARGEEVDIKKIQMTVTYGPGGRLVRTTFDTQQRIEFPVSEQSLT